MNIKKIFFTTSERIWILFSFMLNKIYRQNIHIESINITPMLLIENTPMYLYLKVTGCYKIEIKNFGKFSGKRKEIKINIPKTEKINIKFYGRNQIINKQITLNVFSFNKVKTNVTIDVYPLNLLQKEYLTNLNRKNLDIGIKSFERNINPNLFSKNLNIDSSLYINKVKLKIDNTIIQNYEKSIL